MRSTKSVSFLLLLVVAYLAMPAMASANTISFGPNSFGPFTVGSPSSSFPMTQFNPALGTLTQVDLTVTGNSNAGFNKIENTGGSAGSATLSIGANITVTGPASLVNLTTPATVGSSGLTAWDGITDFAGTSGFGVNGAPASDTQSASISSGLGPYIGGGTVLFNYSSLANFSNSNNFESSTGLTSAGTFDFAATVTYTYTAVPEPSTMTLGFLGLVGMGLVARRRTR
jgi:hypothetical protein